MAVKFVFEEIKEGDIVQDMFDNIFRVRRAVSLPEGRFLHCTAWVVRDEDTVDCEGNVIRVDYDFIMRSKRSLVEGEYDSLETYFEELDVIAKGV